MESGFSLPQNHLDIQLEFRGHGDIIVMATLVGQLIDISYHDMKENFQQDFISAGIGRPFVQQASIMQQWTGI